MGTGLIVMLVVAVVAVGATLIWRQPLLAFAVKSTAYIREVRVEVRKVSWPTLIRRKTKLSRF